MRKEKATHCFGAVVFTCSARELSVCDKDGNQLRNGISHTLNTTGSEFLFSICKTWQISWLKGPVAYLCQFAVHVIGVLLIEAREITFEAQLGRLELDRHSGRPHGRERDDGEESK